MIGRTLNSRASLKKDMRSGPKVRPQPYLKVRRQQPNRKAKHSHGNAAALSSSKSGTKSEPREIATSTPHEEGKSNAAAKTGTKSEPSEIATSTPHEEGEGFVLFRIIGNDDDLEEFEGGLPKEPKLEPLPNFNTDDKSSGDFEADPSDGEDYDEMEDFFKDLPPYVGSDEVTLTTEWARVRSVRELSPVPASSYDEIV